MSKGFRGGEIPLDYEDIDKKFDEVAMSIKNHIIDNYSKTEIYNVIKIIRDEVNAPHSNGNSPQTIKVSKVNKILDSVLEEYGIINKK